MVRKFNFRNVEFELELDHREYHDLLDRLRSMAQAEFDQTVKLAAATRGVSLRPREHILATINRTFYLQNGRFPTQSETLRRLIP